MATSLSNWFQIAQPPFSHVGIDDIGPINVRHAHSFIHSFFFYS